MSDATRRPQDPLDAIAELYRRVRDLELARLSPAGFGPLARGWAYGGAVYFTSSGTFSKGDYPGLRAVQVEVVGGGGGGGGVPATPAGAASAAGGGGGGGYALGFILASTLDSSVTVTVGAGGAGGVGASDGVDGEASSFGSLVVASGGERGRLGVQSGSDRPGSIPGIGGAGIAGDLAGRGHAGEAGLLFGPANRAIGGNGGGSVLAGASRGGNGLSGLGSNGGAGNTYGGGGAGAASRAEQGAFNGGDGAPGIVIVHLFY